MRITYVMSQRARQPNAALYPVRQTFQWAGQGMP